MQIDNSQHVLNQRYNIISNLETNDYFDSIIVQAVKNAVKKAWFWLDIVNRDVLYDFLNKLGFFGKLTFTMDDIIVIAQIFARIIDNTSHYSGANSQNVAKVAESIALYTGFSEVESEKIYLVRLLHDIGKLAVPNEILMKTAKLSEAEYDIVKQHPYFSYCILRQVGGFEDIAIWTGSRHETVDGKGYPFGLQTSAINLGSRILLTADILNDMVRQHKLDGRIVSELINNMDVHCALVRKNIFH